MRKLVVYFSYSGVTAAKAEKLAQELGAGKFELKAAVPYSAEDVNWRDETSRNVKEYKDPSSRPEIIQMPDLTGVEELWVGFPVWWYIQPRIINTFFDRADLSGIKVHLFATSGSTGIEGAVKDLRETYPAADIVEGTRL